MQIQGSWRLKAWRRIVEGGQTTCPLGENAAGLLICSDQGTMAVQMVAGDRPGIDGGDALGGDPQERAAAYSTCLAYFGTFEVQGETVIHRVEGSLYPNWSGTVEPRPFTLKDGVLTLRTPPAAGPGGAVVNEISWVRTGSPE